MEILTHTERRYLSFVNLNNDNCGLGQTILDVLLNSISSMETRERERERERERKEREKREREIVK